MRRIRTVIVCFGVFLPVTVGAEEPLVPPSEPRSAKVAWPREHTRDLPGD